MSIFLSPKVQVGKYPKYTYVRVYSTSLLKYYLASLGLTLFLAPNGISFMF